MTKTHYVLKRPINTGAPYVVGQSATVWYTPNLAQAKPFANIAVLLEWIRMVQMKGLASADGDFEGLQIIRVDTITTVTETVIS